MTFGSEDVDLNLAAALKPQHQHERNKSAEVPSVGDMVIDLASLLKEKSAVFEWITEQNASEPDVEESKNTSYVRT